MTPPLTVTLLGAQHAVVIPPRFAERRELLILAAANTWRGAAATLAVCCPSLAIPAAAVVRVSGVTSEVGARAWEELAVKGVDDLAMFHAAQPILAAVEALVFPSAPEVKAAEDFTGQTGGPPTSPV